MKIKDLYGRAGKWLSNQTIIIVIFILLAIAAAVQSYLGRMQPLIEGGLPYTQYNNYLIFKYAFYHLIEQKDLYILYIDKCGDLFKYSPAFALLFAPFAVVPDIAGLIMWNLLNALVLFFAIKSLPNFKENTKSYMLWFIIIELMTNMQNDQSNGLMAGLLIFAFVFLERDKVALATLFIVLSIYIKLFGVVAFSLFLLYPRKAKFIIYSAIWMFVLAAVPLLVVPFKQLIFLYTSWGNLLSQDHSTSYGFSMMGWLIKWFHIYINKNLLVLVGATIFMLPFIRFKQYNQFNFRILVLSSILIWVIIFNHKAESPSFILAMSGIAIWYFAQLREKVYAVIAIFAFVFTSLSTTDLFPSFIRHGIFYPYLVKAVPSIIIWFLVIYELMFIQKKPENSISVN